LQALATLHNEMFIEAARGLSERVRRNEPGDDRQRIQCLFRLCLARPPSAAESSRLLDLLRTNRSWYEQHPDDAQAMIGDVQPSGQPDIDRAALIATASMVMNLDEFLTRE
jgi:hypothetical protein